MAEEKKPYVAGSESFLHGDDEYTIQYGKVVLPELGERTAAELAVDEEAQEALLAIEGQTAAVKVAK